ncbi:MAG TPA: hypothetical protein VMD02_07280 [Candidatus Omnitrophota bacterium]|nr:hypothetical protein [Candidatus Omnitrophota bacterium]
MAGNDTRNIAKIGLIKMGLPNGGPADRVNFSGNLFQSDLLKVRVEFPAGNIPIDTVFRNLRSEVRDVLTPAVARAFGRDTITAREISSLIVKIEPEKMYTAREIGELLVIANRQESNEPAVVSGAILNDVTIKAVRLDAIDLLLGLVADEEKPKLVSELLAQGVTAIPERAVTGLLASMPESAHGRQYDARQVAVFLYGIISSMPIMEGEPVYDPRVIGLRSLASRDPEKADLVSNMPKVISFLIDRFGIKPENVEYASVAMKDDGFDIERPRLYGLLLRGILEVTSNLPYSRTAVDLSAMVPELVKLGLLYEANGRTGTYAPEEWRSLSALYVRFPDLRARFANDFILPSVETGAGTEKQADPSLKAGRIYFESAGFVVWLGSLPESERPRALGPYFQDRFPDDEFTSVRVSAFADCGRSLILNLLGLDRGDGGALVNHIIRLMVEQEAARFDAKYIDRPDGKLKERIEERTPVTFKLVRAAITEGHEIEKELAENLIGSQPVALYLMMVLAAGNVSSDVRSKLVSLIIKALMSLPGTDLMNKLLLAYVINMEEPGSKSPLSTPGIKNAVMGYFKRAARPATTALPNEVLVEAEERLFTVEKGSVQVPKALHDANESAALIEALFITAIRSEINDIPAKGEAAIMGALDIARKMAEFADSEADASPDIAYLPGFIAARISSEHFEKSVDDLKKAISADRGHSGLFIAMDVVQDILGPEIYTALGKAFKEMDHEELFVESLIYSHIMEQTSRIDKVKTILASIKSVDKAWITLVTLLNHDRFAEARQMIGIVLDHARKLAGKANPYTMENIRKAVDSADASINAIFTGTFK